MNIIINADDFGLTSELNICVQYLYNKGIVFSTTIIANSPFFDQAVGIAKESPGLGVGIHLCLDGPFNINKELNSTLNVENGQFYDNISAVKKLKSFCYCSNDIYKEYDLQMQKVLDNGIKITHIDHHHHFHLYYPSLKQIIKISKKYNIKSIRSQKILVPKSRKLFNVAYRSFHQSFVKKYFKVPDGYFELLRSSDDPINTNLNRLSFLFLSHHKCIEIQCHPNGHDDFDTLFLEHPSTMKLIKNQKNINYSNLK